jgi:hypothetical protein
MIYDLVSKYVLSADPQAVVRSLDGVIEITSSVISSNVEDLKPQLAFFELRQQRNQILAQSDWMAVSDRTMTQAQIDYRQALRDIPANSTPALDENGNLTRVNWPTPPND